jgi:hypothetical protein
MYGSTPRGRRETYSYYITHAKVNGKKVRKKTNEIEGQITEWLSHIEVDPSLIPEIQKTYQTEFHTATQKDKEKEIRYLKGKMSVLREEEARLGRLLITGNMSEDTYNQLRSEWQEKVLNLQIKIEELEVDSTRYLDDLEIGLVLLAKASRLFDRLESKKRNELLQIIIKRIIINRQGKIIDYELNSPFAYLSTLASKFSKQSKEKSGSEQIPLGA